MEKLTISVAEMATMLGISLANSYVLTRRPDFTAALRMGRRILISVPLLQDWLRREAEKPIV